MDESKMAVFDDLVTKGRARGGIELKSAIAMGFPHVQKASMVVTQKDKQKVISLPRPKQRVIVLDRVG